MKKNNPVLIGILLFLIIGTILAVYLCFNRISFKNNNQSNENEQATEKEENKEIEYTFDEEGLSFFCSNKPLGQIQQDYLPGDYVYCSISFELNVNRAGIKEIWVEYYLNDDIEYIETLDDNRNWTIEENGNKLHFKTDVPTVYDEYFYQAKLKIKPSTNQDKISIIFNNIRYKDEENKYYKTTDSIHSLNIAKATNYHYEETVTHDSFTFYKFDNEKGYQQINKYECQSDSCYTLTTQCISYKDLDNGKMFLIDGDETILYDFNKGVLGRYTLDVSDLDDYFIVQDINTKKYGIINKEGFIVKNFTSEKLGTDKIAKCFNQKAYSIKNNLIIEQKNNKYGIIKITEDKTVVKHKFDDIRLFDDKYFKAKIEDKWYLYSIDNSEKVIDEGYEELFIVNNQIILAQINNYLYIKDIKGNNIIEDKIKVMMPYNENACCGTLSGISFEKVNDNINILIDEDLGNHDYKTHNYEYNINEKKLTKKDSN